MSGARVADVMKTVAFNHLPVNSVHADHFPFESASRYDPGEDSYNCLDEEYNGIGVRNFDFSGHDQNINDRTEVTYNAKMQKKIYLYVPGVI